MLKKLQGKRMNEKKLKQAFKKIQNCKTDIQKLNIIFKLLKSDEEFKNVPDKILVMKAMLFLARFQKAKAFSNSSPKKSHQN